MSFACLLASLLFAACSSPAVTRAPTAELDAFVAKASQATTISERWHLATDARLNAGLGIGYFGVFSEGGVVSVAASGKRTIEPVKTFGEKDLLELGSVTKNFTGILIHLAVNEGKLRLDTKLSEILPSLEGTEAGGATILELGLHRSGLPREPKGITIPNPANPRHHLNRDEVLAALAKVKLAVIPTGKTEHDRVYSNWGYLALGMVIEKVFGRSYKDLVENRVLFPLGMRDSGVDRKTRKHGKWIAKASPGFALDGSSLPLRDYDSFAAATGGVESNSVDMKKYLAAVGNPSAFAPAKLAKAMLDGMNSGIGWDSDPGNPLLWKNGATSAHTAILIFDRTTAKGIFVGSNSMVSPDELGWFAVGTRPADNLLMLTFPKRVPSADEITRLKGIFIPPAPIPAGQPLLRRVDISENLGHLVAHYAYDVLPTGALLIPDADADLWSVVDGMANVDKIRVTNAGINATTFVYSERATFAELKKISNEPEKYPALEE